MWRCREILHLLLQVEKTCKQLVDLFEGIQPHFPLWVEGLIFEADVLELVVRLAPLVALGMIAALTWAAVQAVFALVVDVPDLVPVGFVQLMYRDVIELRHESLSLLNFAVAVRL